MGFSRTENPGRGKPISFSRASSEPRDQTQVSHIAGMFFTIWATRETFCQGSFVSRGHWKEHCWRKGLLSLLYFAFTCSSALSIRDVCVWGHAVIFCHSLVGAARGDFRTQVRVQWPLGHSPPNTETSCSLTQTDCHTPPEGPSLITRLG